MASWQDLAQPFAALPGLEPVSAQDAAPSSALFQDEPGPTRQSLTRETPPGRDRALVDRYGWPRPSSLGSDPDEARAAIALPEFDPLLLEKARVISGRYPLAEAEYRTRRA